MRLLVITMIAALVALPALAGGNKGASATAVGVGVGVATGGAGGAASASASSGDTFAIGLPSASGGALSNAWQCATSEQVNVLGIYAHGWTNESKLCVAMLKRRMACRNNLVAACKRLTHQIVNGEFDEDYEAPEPEVVLSKEDKCKPDTHGVIPAFCPGGMFGG